MNATRKEKGRAALAAIAKHILTVPDDNWCMGVWRRVNDCGTAGCAVGSSIDLPEVQACGLMLKANDDDDLFYPDIGSTPRVVDFFQPIAVALDIPLSVTKRLFDLDCYQDYYDDPLPTQAEVSARILDYLKETESEP